jgi:hypothetical protein
MKFLVKTSAAGILLLFGAASCFALTIGRARGAIVLGQPLSITVPVQTDEGDDFLSLCLDASVFYGDVQQARAHTTLLTTSSPSRRTALVEVRSLQVVDEPVVTVNLHAGCAQKIARRFVFFADIPSEAAIAVPLPVSALAPAAVSARADVERAILPARDADPVVRSKPVAVKPADISSAVTAKARTRRTARGTKILVAGNRAASKLELVSLDAGQLHELELKFTRELLADPVENSNSAATAAAWWRALNAQPEDIVRDWQRLQGLDGDLKILRAVTAKNESHLLEMQQLLRAAESGRFANGLVHGLIALLLVSLTGVFFLWRRQNRKDQVSHTWWQSSEAISTGQNGQEAEGATNVSLAVAGELPTRTEFVDINLELKPDAPSLKQIKIPSKLASSRGKPRDRESFFPSSTGWTGDRGFSHSMVNSLRTTNSEELVDVRQQADFFVLLGQYDRAIQVLRERLDWHGEASPLVYLDLMQLLHRLDRRIDFNQCRDQFNRLFTGRVPEYGAFDQKGKGLEAYPDVLARITADWTSELILENLENFIFCRPSADPGAPFDLLAFEDLLMLHAVATWRASGPVKGYPAA